MRKDMIGHLSSVYIILSIILTCFSSCKNEESFVDSKNVQQLKIAYLPKGINPDMAISNCDDIFEYPEVLLKDTTVTNPEFILTFISELNKLKKSNRSINYDFRIKCLIILKQGEKKEICFGEDHLIVFDGILMEDNTKLINQINLQLYK
jgi:hypothetical protein